MAGYGVLTILTQFDVVHSLFASFRSCKKLCDVVVSSQVYKLNIITIY